MIDCPNILLSTSERQIAVKSSGLATVHIGAQTPSELSFT